MSWNGSDSNKVKDQRSDVKQRKNKIPSTPTPKTYTYKRGALAGLIVVALGGAALWWFFGGGRGATRLIEGGGEGTRRPTTIAETNACANKADAIPVSNQSQIASHIASNTSPFQSHADDERVDEEQSEATNAVPVRPKPVLPSGTDELIAMTTTAEEGALIPPLPDLSAGDTEKFLESYRKPIAIDEKDSEAVKNLKQHVNAVREQIAGFIAENPGRSFSDILNEHREAFNANSELYAEAKKNYETLAEGGNAELAEQYRVKANELLTASGAKTIEQEEEEETENE